LKGDPPIFLEKRRNCRFFESRMEVTRSKREIDNISDVRIGIRIEVHCLTSQVGKGLESDCLLGQLNRILDISDSVAGLKVEE